MSDVLVELRIALAGKLRRKESLRLLDEVLAWFREGGGAEVERRVRERMELISAGVREDA
jgi:hypothetical protein